MGLAGKWERFIVQFFYSLDTIIMNYCQLRLQIIFHWLVNLHRGERQLYIKLLFILAYIKF